MVLKPMMYLKTTLMQRMILKMNLQVTLNMQMNYIPLEILEVDG